jgi:three-Cys-motif partner protein
MKSESLWRVVGVGQFEVEYSMADVPYSRSSSVPEDEWDRLTDDEKEDYLLWIGDFTQEPSTVDDVIGEWTEVKLEILRKYAHVYTQIMSNQASIHRYLYIDAFASSGQHRSRSENRLVYGSPVIALETEPPFHEYHFIDLNQQKIQALQARLEQHAPSGSDVHVYAADANEALVQHILPRARWEDRHRALCFLDPYGLSLQWSVVEAIGKMKSVEIILHFPIMAINRNVLRRDPTTVKDSSIQRMNSVWGDRSWREVAYAQTQALQMNMFSSTLPEAKVAGNAPIIQAFKERLRTVAGFKYVPEPIPMRNSSGGEVYYIYFASPNETGARIVGEIFSKYRERKT